MLFRVKTCRARCALLTACRNCQHALNVHDLMAAMAHQIPAMPERSCPKGFQVNPSAPVGESIESIARLRLALVVVSLWLRVSLRASSKAARAVPGSPGSPGSLRCVVCTGGTRAHGCPGPGPANQQPGLGAE
ncbi:unnamed protein product [Effrenium voratum]|uniref:Uncharacterized protein n=1 Tax=Effrenium voratum TaxID=2562239 RepID=A0AA36MXN7_9DINO|nr:unnamed protein product [Effrenium voratum]